MLQKVMFALLFATTAHAHKVPSPLFSIEHVTPKDTQSVRLFRSGSWTGPARSGKLAEADLKRFESELDAAKWTVTTAKIRCMARSENFTRYYVEGKLVFESHVCDGKSLDADSQKVVTDANALLPGF